MSKKNVLDFLKQNEVREAEVPVTCSVYFGPENGFHQFTNQISQ